MLRNLFGLVDNLRQSESISSIPKRTIVRSEGVMGLFKHFENK
jgi:hypothetical protein